MKLNGLWAGIVLTFGYFHLFILGFYCRQLMAIYGEAHILESLAIILIISMDTGFAFRAYNRRIHSRSISYRDHCDRDTCHSRPTYLAAYSLLLNASKKS